MRLVLPLVLLRCRPGSILLALMLSHPMYWSAWFALWALAVACLGRFL